MPLVYFFVALFIPWNALARINAEYLQRHHDEAQQQHRLVITHRQNVARFERLRADVRRGGFHTFEEKQRAKDSLVETGPDVSDIAENMVRHASE